MIKTLKEFQYIDEYGKDQGANVRQKAKDISNLLTDESRLRQERRSRAHMRDRMTGLPGEEEEEANENSRRRSRSVPPKRSGANNDDDLRRAIEESKKSLAAEQAKQGHMTAEERDLQATFAGRPVLHLQLTQITAVQTRTSWLTRGGSWK